MYPEDRVLVAYLPHPRDLSLIEQAGWYRIPQRHAPKGLHAEYYAFYFNGRFGAQKWSIPVFAERLGHELVRRADLLPDEPHHPRADDLYYKVQLGPLQWREEAIPSLRWRRITFIHTTWDRFQTAREINDLILSGGDYVDRVYAALKEEGFQPERAYRVTESTADYPIPLVIFCKNGPVDVFAGAVVETAVKDEMALTSLVTMVKQQVQRLGGPA